jgi:hypothetical protein
MDLYFQQDPDGININKQSGSKSWMSEIILGRGQEGEVNIGRRRIITSNIKGATGITIQAQKSTVISKQG